VSNETHEVLSDLTNASTSFERCHDKDAVIVTIRKEKNLKKQRLGYNMACYDKYKRRSISSRGYRRLCVLIYY
jgi:hypothetical protein